MIILSLVFVGDLYFNLSFILIALLLNLTAIGAIIADQIQVPRYQIEKTRQTYEKLAQWKYKWQIQVIFVFFFVIVFVFGKSEFGDLYPGTLIFAAGILLSYNLQEFERYRKQRLIRKRAEELSLRLPQQ